MAGNWGQSNKDTVGLYDTSTATFYQSYTDAGGYADAAFAYGSARAGWRPIIGDWLGIDNLYQIVAGQVATVPTALGLTHTQLQPIVQDAVARSTSAGLNAGSVAQLAPTSVAAADLSGAVLGETSRYLATTDGNAANHGWSIDPTPAADKESAPTSIDGQLFALSPQAVDQIDLSTVIEQGMGHAVGPDMAS